MAEKYFMHIRSWQEGTEGLTLEQESMYLRIINLMYQCDGILEDDDSLLAHKTFVSKRKYTSLKKQLIAMGKFSVVDGLLVNEKTLKELGNINEKSAKNARAAKIKAEKYKNKNPEKTPKVPENNDFHSADAEVMDSERMCESGAIQGNRGTGDKRTTKVVPKKFSEFWEAFGDKRGKAAAEKAFIKHAKDETIADKIIAGAKRYAASRGEDSKYWKMAQGWLNDERWSDEEPSSTTTVEKSEMSDDQIAQLNGFDRETRRFRSKFTKERFDPYVCGGSPELKAAMKAAMALPVMGG